MAIAFNIAGTTLLGAGDSRLYGYLLADRSQRWMVGADPAPSPTGQALSSEGSPLPD